MTPLSLEKLEIRGLRGVVDLPLRLDGKNVVILGENGVGKSSIVDALEFLFTGKIGALEGTQGISTARHAPHVGVDRTSTSVTLTVNPGAVAVTRTFSQEPLGEGDVAALLSEGSNANFILRRSQLLRFILTKPAERYQAISPLIGVEDLETRELALKSVRDDLRGVVATRQAELEAAGREAASTVGVFSIEPEAVVLAAFNAIRTGAGLPPVGTIDRAVGDSPSPAVSQPSLSNARELDQATKAIVLLPDTELLPRLKSDFQTLREAAASLLSRRNLDELPLLEFLRRGHEFLTHAATTTCPLCEQQIVQEDIVASLKRRIGELDSLSVEGTIYRERLAAAREAVAGLEQRCAELQASLVGTGIGPELAEVSITGDVLGRDLRERLSRAEDPRYLPTPSQAEDLVEGLRPGCASLRDALQGVLSQARSRNVDSAVRLAAASDAFRRWNQARTLLSESQHAYSAASAVFDHFVAARRLGVDDLYAAIQVDLTRFYSTLHPGESHRDVVLRPSAGRRASTNLQLTSFGQPDTDPRAYASEAHLDTLGLCIFLAFAKVFLTGFPLIVLDDVLTTVDAQHRQRVAELLIDEFPSTQLLLTSHDGIWFEEIQALSRSHGLEGRFTFYTITGWTKEGGPEIRQNKPTWERIQQLLTDGEKSLAGNESRRYGEWVTREICKRTDAPIPYSAIERPTLGALLPSAKVRLLEMIHQQAEKDAFLHQFQSIEATTFMANLLSHDNPLAGNLSVEEIRTFAEAVQELVRGFSCGNCQSMLVYSRDLHELSCPRRDCTTKTRYRTS